MKEENAKVEYDRHQLLLYVEKDDGTFGPMQTGSFMSKNYIDDFWEKRKHLEQQSLEKLISGLISPVGYYLLLVNLSPADCAARVQLSVAQVKKHCEPTHFAKMSLDIMARYADVFGVPPSALCTITILKSKKISVNHRKTSNPLITIQEIDEAQA